NTNAVGITEAGLGAYSSRSLGIYKCPADSVLSDEQRNAGWTARARVRSYSMNAMVGDAGEVSKSGSNVNNPDYVQFFSQSQIPEPAHIFVFLDEHPDSINDGYFLNSDDYNEGGKVGLWWLDCRLPITTAPPVSPSQTAIPKSTAGSLSEPNVPRSP